MLIINEKVRNAMKIYKVLKNKQMGIVELNCTIFEITVHCGNLSKRQEDERLKKWTEPQASVGQYQKT